MGILDELEDSRVDALIRAMRKVEDRLSDIHAMAERSIDEVNKLDIGKFVTVIDEILAEQQSLALQIAAIRGEVTAGRKSDINFHSNTSVSGDAKIAQGKNVEQKND